MTRRRIFAWLLAGALGATGLLIIAFRSGSSPEEALSAADTVQVAPRVDLAARYDPPMYHVKPPKPPPGYNQSAPEFPNVTLWDHNGKKVKFYDDLVKGKIVVLNFFYATCLDL